MDAARQALAVQLRTEPAQVQVHTPALSARQVLAQQLYLDLSQILLVSAEPVEWPDACLGRPD